MFQHSPNLIFSITDEQYIILSRKDITIGDIHLLDLLPMLKQRLTSDMTIANILYMFPQLDSGKFTRLSFLCTEVNINVIKDREIIEGCLLAIKNYPNYNSYLANYNIYELMKVIHDLTSKRDIYKMERFNSFIMQVLQYPKINPLKISLLLGNKDYTYKYLYDVRSNLVTSYKSCMMDNIDLPYCNLVKDNILLRIFLYKYILTRDIYLYLIFQCLI